MIFALNIALKIPGIYQELPPNTYCDEGLIINYAYKNYSEDKFYYYGVNQINYYLAAVPAHVIDFFSKEKLTKGKFIILARIIGPVFFNSLGAIIIFLVFHLLFNSLLLSNILSILYTFSPMILGLSRIFYPDHYIIIFFLIL